MRLCFFFLGSIAKNRRYTLIGLYDLSDEKNMLEQTKMGWVKHNAAGYKEMNWQCRNKWEYMEMYSVRSLGI